MKCCSLLLSFEDGETFQKTKTVSLCCEKQQTEINWLNFSCTPLFFLTSRSGHKLQKEADQNLQLQRYFQSCCTNTVYTVPKCHGWNPTGAGSSKSAVSWTTCHYSLMLLSYAGPFEIQCFCTFSSGLKCPTLSVGATCLSDFGSIFFKTLRLMITLNSLALSSAHT